MEVVKSIRRREKIKIFRKEGDKRSRGGGIRKKKMVNIDKVMYRRKLKIEKYGDNSLSIEHKYLP